MSPLSRRAVLQASGAAALFGTAARTASAQESAQKATQQPVITRRIPRTGEEVPAIGLGTFMTFDKKPGAPRDHLREVLHRFHAGGGRVVDTSPLYGLSEVTVGDFGNGLDLFIADKAWATGEYLGDDSQVRRQFEQSLTRVWRTQIDVMQVHSLVNADAILPVLRTWKREGRIRYLGVTHHDPAYLPFLERYVRDGDLDFVQVSYSIRNRAAGQRLLPLAADKGTAVLVNMPLEKARLHHLVRNQQLPGFAAEIGATSWAQFFLKWVIGHPAVTCALPATTNPDHVVDNLGALRGPLPDQRLRDRMVRHLEAVPGFADLLTTPWYPGKTFDGLVRL
ncbi:diketogulonate reductase-like aldo/keto reductase [Lentzea atacamensis]|uniref:Diketogulonate reductase-like aldo/keto reductase n=1 Tax=Lentzea atacamensis TaxID=531938 RepID=A0ABX9E9L0_9PSEU|nr:aldo/keto reductase [Lentzea atacamensis]RAS66845.1 diketogulonate reductase-like aldo/keto reductase [Lentzea atacamensis]